MREEGQMKTRRKEGNKKEMEGGETREHINKGRRIFELYEKNGKERQGCEEVKVRKKNKRKYGSE